MNSRSDWLSLDWSGAEHYQRKEKATEGLRSHKWPIFGTFTVSSLTTRQLDNLSVRVTEICTKCALYVLF